MPSSGRGTSFNSDFTRCMRYGYYKHVRGFKPRDVEPAIAPLVGEACHAYFAKTFQGFDAEAEAHPAKEGAEAAFVGIIDAARPQFQDVEQLEEKLNITRPVLTQWFARQWDKLTSGLETTLAVEVDVELWLPQVVPFPHGVICECDGPQGAEPHRSLCLRRVSGRIDRVVAYDDDLNIEAPRRVAIQDFKTTGSNDLKGYVASAFRSDQHLLYVKGWNAIGAADNTSLEANEVLYSAVRLTKAITALSFHDEPRLVNDEMVADAWQRTMALRAHLSSIWNQTQFAFPENTAPWGPCMKFGSRCEFWDLCEDPNGWDQMVSEAGSFEVDEEVLKR